MKSSLPETNSSFLTGAGQSDFFSAFLLAEITLQSLQGCAPSKVRATACSNEFDRRLLASMLVQARVWSKAQCPPTATMSAKIIKP